MTYKDGVGEFVLMSDLIPGQLYRIKPDLCEANLNVRLASMITVVCPHPKISGYWNAFWDSKIGVHRLPAMKLRGRMAMFLSGRWPGNDSWGVFLVGEKFLVLQGYHLESNQPVKWAV